MLFDRLQLYYDAEPHAAALNMALDESLVRQTRMPALRVYRWAESSVSFGYFGHHAEVVERWPGRVAVRRWTGGGEVPHGEDFTYTLAIPGGHPFARGRARESYRAIHAELAPLLPGAELATSDAPAAPTCFTRPVVADLIIGSTKVAGAAQRRGTFGLLHQGSIAALWSEAHDSHRAFAEALARALAAEVVERSYSVETRHLASALEEHRYGNERWLERR